MKSLLAPWLVRKWAWSSTKFAIDVAGLPDFKRRCGKDYVGESLREAICCRVSVRIQSEMESRWKADGVFLGKLDLSDKAIVGVGQMRIAAEIVCYNTAISTCVKEPNSLMALALFKKTDQGSMRKDQIVLNPTISACERSMSWPMVLHLLCQMPDTELRKNVCHFNVVITASGKASHWNIALKLLKKAKEYDGYVSNTIMDNTIFTAWEKDDQWSIELKMLVEHGERQHFLQLRVESVRCGQAAGKRTDCLPFDGREVRRENTSEQQCSAERSS